MLLFYCCNVALHLGRVGNTLRLTCRTLKTKEDTMSALYHIERGTLRTALALLLVIGIVPVALGADGRG